MTVYVPLVIRLTYYYSSSNRHTCKVCYLASLRLNGDQSNLTAILHDGLLYFEVLFCFPWYSIVYIKQLHMPCCIDHKHVDGCAFTRIYFEFGKAAGNMLKVGRLGLL